MGNALVASALCAFVATPHGASLATAVCNAHLFWTDATLGAPDIHAALAATMANTAATRHREF